MPPGTAPAQEDSVPLNVVRIRVPTLLLDGRHPADGFLQQHQHVIIYADNLQVRGRYCLLGRTVEIFARRIEADQAIIDVSGAPVTISYDVAQADASLDGTAASPNGKPGADGGRGRDGGAITITAGEITGNLTLVANGSQGGNSQRGGNGASPAPRNGQDGRFTKHDPPAGPFGARVVQPKGLHWYWEMAYGEKGGDALPGGDAGPPGRPGDGGAGGHLDLRYVAVPALPPQFIADGGAAGRPGDPALPGAAGVPGLGGRHCLYQYHVTGNPFAWTSTWEGYADSHRAEVKDVVRQHKLSTRASSGAKSDQRGTVPEAPRAEPGPTGTNASRQVATDAIAGECDTGYLDLIRQSAAADAAHGNTRRALDRYQWVAALTRTGRDDQRVNLYKEVTERIEALKQ